MKRLNFAFALSLTMGSQVFADDPIYIYLIDPKDTESIRQFKSAAVDPNADPTLIPDISLEPPARSSSTNATTMPIGSTPEAAAEAARNAKKTLDDLIDGLSKKTPLTKSQERILKKVTADQMEFLHLLDQFCKTAFDPQDDQSIPEFNKIRDRIVSLVFDAQSEKHFYGRLYLINKSWLENSKEVARYASLDHALRDRALAIEERSRRYRQIITGVAAVGGAVGGGFLSYKATQRILPVVANEAGWSQIVRWAGRGTIVFIGAGVGAIVGAEIGFLGSEYLFSRRDYVNPIDGDEDLRDILQVIDSLP